MPRPRVLIAYKSLPAYRVRFFEDLRDRLRDDGIHLDVVYGDPDRHYRKRGDTTVLGEATFLRNRFFYFCGKRLIWQPVLHKSRTYDLVVLEQANSLLVNYPLLFLQRLGWGPRVALWGHGANLQSASPNGLLETLKRTYSRIPHWWFAYTEGSASRIMKLGFARNRITVVQNAIDTRSLRVDVASVTAKEAATFRVATGSKPGQTALFIGSLYPEKRLDFLLEAAALVNQERPNFTLLIAGDGPDRELVASAASEASYIHFLGRLDGEARALALRISDCVLMPGLVGLGILDAFAAEAPMITTAHRYHSPEIEYLAPGVNGLLLPEGTTSQEYAQAVVNFLDDQALQLSLRQGCQETAGRITNEAMVENFRQGVHMALEAIK